MPIFAYLKSIWVILENIQKNTKIEITYTPILKDNIYWYVCPSTFFPMHMQACDMCICVHVHTYVCLCIFTKNPTNFVIRIEKNDFSSSLHHDYFPHVNILPQHDF